MPSTTWHPYQDPRKYTDQDDSGLAVGVQRPSAVCRSPQEASDVRTRLGTNFSEEKPRPVASYGLLKHPPLGASRRPRSAHPWGHPCSLANRHEEYIGSVE